MSEENKQPTYVAENESAEADSIFGGTPAAQPEPPKKRRSRSTVGLLIAICLAAIIGAGLLTLKLLNDMLGSSDVPPEETQAAAENIPLHTADELNLTDVDIQGSTPFHVTRTFRGREDAAAVYAIDGYEDIAIDNALLSTLAYNGSHLEASRSIEEHPADPGKYGLADPRADVTLTYEDGTSFRFLIGDDSPMESSQIYCSVDDHVYLVRNSLVANYCKSPESFLSKTVLEAPEEGSEPIVTELRIERTDLDWDIYLTYDEEAAESSDVGGTAATHIMQEPIFTYLNVEKSKDITNGMFGLTAQEIAVIHPTDADMSRTGLDDPFCKVTMKTDDGKTRVMTFGKTYVTEDGKTLCYAYLDGTKEIFGVSDENAKWLTVQPGDISSANIFVTNVWNIGTLDITDKTHEFRFVGEGDKDFYTVTRNGEDCDKERFRTLYRFLLYIYGEELYIGELPEGDPDAEIHLTTQNGKEDYTISFYRVSDLKTIVARDGQPSYVIRSSALDTLSYNLDIFEDTDKAFKNSWQ